MKTYLICPECTQGKHPNCTGAALNEKTDTLDPCECIHTAHSGLRLGVKLL